MALVGARCRKTLLCIIESTGGHKLPSVHEIAAVEPGGGLAEVPFELDQYDTGTCRMKIARL